MICPPIYSALGPPLCNIIRREKFCVLPNEHLKTPPTRALQLCECAIIFLLLSVRTVPCIATCEMLANRSKLCLLGKTPLRLSILSCMVPPIALVNPTQSGAPLVVKTCLPSRVTSRARVRLTRSPFVGELGGSTLSSSTQGALPTLLMNVRNLLIALPNIPKLIGLPTLLIRLWLERR